MSKSIDVAPRRPSKERSFWRERQVALLRRCERRESYEGRTGLCVVSNQRLRCLVFSISAAHNADATLLVNKNACDKTGTSSRLKATLPNHTSCHQRESSCFCLSEPERPRSWSHRPCIQRLIACPATKMNSGPPTYGSRISGMYAAIWKPRKGMLLLPISQRGLYSCKRCHGCAGIDLVSSPRACTASGAFSFTSRSEATSCL